MSYNVFFTGSFDVMQQSEPHLSIRVDIFKKGYVGDPKPMILTATPVIHEWQDDNPKAPIKGSTCKIGIIADGTVTLDSFYSNADDTFRVEVKRVETEENLFIGYILQDDCRELQVDFNHEIYITASDGLGLIKDVTLDQAAVLYGTPVDHSITGIFTIAGNLQTICSHDVNWSYISVGTIFTITAGPLQGTYTCTGVRYEPTYGWYVNIAESVGYVTAYNAHVIYNDPINISGFVSLLDIVRLCFKATQLDLVGMNVVSTLVPSGGGTGRLLEDTYVIGETFLQNDKWMSCYDVMDTIMTRFHASAFQSYGFWWIVRWGELYFQASSVPPYMDGWRYNGDFVYLGPGGFDNYGYSLVQGDFEFGLEKSIIRPYQYVREQFNYVQTESLLKNYNLQKLGNLLTSYTFGTLLIKEYAIPYWFDYHLSPPSCNNRYIRVIIDDDPTSNQYGTELDRYLVIDGNLNLNRALESTPIELTKGDKFTFSFKMRSEGIYTDQTIVQYNIYLVTNIGTYGLDSNGHWGSFAANHINYYWRLDNSEEWFDVTISSESIPENGLLYIDLPQFPRFSPEYRTYIKDMSFTVEGKTDNSTRAIGHEHIDTNAITIKNNTDITIGIDDSPRSSIAGTLFLSTSTGYVRDRTSRWEYIFSSAETGKLGYLTTLENMMERWMVRSKYDGNLLKIFNGSGESIKFISNYHIFNILNPSDLRRFVPGALSIDYKHNSATATLWQITNYEETPADVEDYYQFNYLYEKS
jgi:hypothetical protein